MTHMAILSPMQMWLLPESPTLNLYDLDCGDTAKIHRVSNDDPRSFCACLAELGLLHKLIFDS